MMHKAKEIMGENCFKIDFFLQIQNFMTWWKAQTVLGQKFIIFGGWFV